MNPWSTACLDWEDRILTGRSLMPRLPLYREEAARALRIFKRLRVPDVIGMPRMDEAAGGWFLEIVEALFGSYDPETNRRMIQEIFLLVPKKNGKSSYAAAIMVVALIVNRRPNAEYLLIAPTKEIAGIAFRQAAGTINADPELKKLFHIQSHIKTISRRDPLRPASLSIKAADTDAITGSKSTGILVDETHVFASHTRAVDVFAEVAGALAARPDGFMIQITTQSKAPPKGVFAAQLALARDIRDGKIDLPLLPILYELPARITKDGGWRDPATWPLVNPNLGRSVDTNFLTTGLAKAEREGPPALALFASQHFNVQIGGALRTDGWAGAAVWHRGVEKGLTLEAILDRCEVVTVGIDGGGLDDLLGVAVIGREKDTRRWLAWTHALVSPEGMERRKINAPEYADFQQDGDLTVVDNLPEDLDWLCATIGRINETGLLAKVGLDAIGIGGAVEALAEIGVTEEAGLLVAIPQGIKLMGAIKTTERKLVDGSFRHAGSRLMAWCAGNAKVVPTPTAMRIARDDSGFGKIDPLMALFNAVALMSVNPMAPPQLDVAAMIA